MSSNCKCLNPEKGGTKCPAQHIAICIRGKDRECYGECIPIPSQFHFVSQNFARWSENIIKEKVVVHMKDLIENYQAFGSKDYIIDKLHPELQPSFQNFSGRIDYITLNSDRIIVKFSFSFEATADLDGNAASSAY